MKPYSKSNGWAGLALWIALGGAPAAVAQIAHPFPAEFPDFSVAGRPGPFPQPDGTTILVGATARGFGVVRVSPDGTPDRGFGRNGLTELVVWGTGEYPSIMLRQLDGRFVIAGNVKDYTIHPLRCDQPYQDCNIHIVLFRLEVDGRQDFSFNRYGRLVLRVGDLPPPSSEGWRWDEGSEAFVESLVLRPDGALDVLSLAGTYVARVRPDGSMDPEFKASVPWQQAVERDFVAAVPFYNAALDQYFVTSDLGEIAGLPRDPVTGWSARDGWFHVYPAGWTATPTVPVCRFYGRPDAGLDSHVLTANAGECAALAADGGARWSAESPETFRVILPDPLTGACPPGHPPVYRLWNGRADGGHVLSTWPSRSDPRIAKGYVAEGWGPESVAMCAAP